MENLEKEFEKYGFKKVKDDGKTLIYKKQNTFFAKNGIVCKKELVGKNYNDIKTIIFKIPNKRLFFRRDIVCKNYFCNEPFSINLEFLSLLKKQAEILFNN